MRINFGKYHVPPTLQKLIDLHEELDDAEQFYRGLHFYLALGGFRYFNTPCDVIVFGNIGMDGIHYGFLTDFGFVPDLEMAPIVCISPMDFDRPTRIVAKNLREFLSINLTDEALFYNDFENEKSYLAAKQKWAEEAANSPYQPSENDKAVRETIRKRLMENIRMPLIDNPYHYVRNVDLERQKSVTIRTLDGLGVTAPLSEGEKHIPFPIQKRAEPDLKLLKEYLNSAPVASRLALIRDIQLYYVLEEQQELRDIVLESMNKMGLSDEARRLSYERSMD